MRLHEIVGFLVTLNKNRLSIENQGFLYCVLLNEVLYELCSICFFQKRKELPDK